MKLFNKDKSSNKKNLCPFVSLLIPFSFDRREYTRNLATLIKNGWNENNTYVENEFFSFVNELIEKETTEEIVPSKIAKCLNREFNDTYFYNGGVSRNVKIKSASLYTFKTGVAFLVLYLNYENITDIQELIDRNNQIKSFSHKREQIVELSTSKISFEESLLESDNDLLDVKDVKSNSTFKLSAEILPNYIRGTEVKLIPKGDAKTIIYKSGIPTDLSTYFEKLLMFTSEKKYFLGDRVSKSTGYKMSSKANIFSFAITEEYDNSFKEETYKLGHGYKASYKKSDFSNNEFIFNTFDNSCWSVSREGVSNLVHFVSDNQTNQFFKDTYLKRISNYLSLYILALHQYYALLNISGKISTLPNSIKEYTNNKKNYDSMIDIYDEVNFIYLKCIYHEVSHISHQNEVYKKIYKMLGIDSLLTAVNYEMDRFTNIVGLLRHEVIQEETKQQDEYYKQQERQRIIDQKAEDEREKRKSSFERFITIIASTLAFFAVFESIWNISKYLNVKDLLVLSFIESIVVRELIFVSFTIISWLTIIIIVYAKRIKKK